MSSILRWLLSLALPVLLSSALPLTGQQTGMAAGRVIGRVIDQSSRRPIQGVSVAVGDSVVRAISDEQGRFAVDALPAGPTRFSFAMIGYSTRSDSVTVPAGATQELEVTLSREAIGLDPIAVTVRSGWLESSGFYERQQANPGGTFITRDEAERRQSRQLTDLLRQVPGIRTFFLDAGRVHVRFNREGADDLLAFDPANDQTLPGCEPDLYLDGILYREQAATGYGPRVVGFDIVDISQIEGVEAYSGPNAPLQYQHPCGVILVWTRRGTAPGIVARTAPAPAGGAGAAPGAGRLMPAIEEGTRVRIRPRVGSRVTGTVRLVDADSMIVNRGGESRRYTLQDLRSLDRDGGLARPADRFIRGGKWGFMMSVVGVAVAAALEEFQALGYDEKSIAANSPRKPAFAIKLIGAGTVGGALLGGTLWRYRQWVEVPLR